MEGKNNYSAGDKINATELNQIAQNANDVGFRDSVQAGETITALRPIFLDDATNKWKYCDANDTARLNFDGFSLEAGSANAEMKAQVSGIVRGLSSLDVGKKYYVQDDGTIGTTAGTYGVLVGIAITATELLILKTNNFIIGATASDVLKASADTEVTNFVGTSPALVKSVRIKLTGTIRVKFDIKYNTGDYANGRIYVNGVAVGSVQTNATTSYITYSEDINVQAGDLVQLYCYKGGGTGTMSYKNFRIYYCTNLISESDIVTN